MYLRRGFTLIELSIVLVIIALLAAVIVTGRTLIAGYEIRAAISEVEKYIIAHNNFKLKFNTLPGDFNRAFQLWGTQCAPTATTCNGDGDGIVWEDQYSPRRTWVHLSLAGLLGDVNYGPLQTSSSSAPGGNFHLRPGIDVPKPYFKGETSWLGIGTGIDDIPWWSMYQISSGFFSGGSYDTDYGRSRPNTLWMVGLRPSGANIVVYDGAVLTPTQAYAIDSKMDDGIADSGKVIGVNGRSTPTGDRNNCVTPNTNWSYLLPAGAQYDLVTQPNRQSCAIGFSVLN